MSKQQEKYLQYAALITEKLGEIFDEEESNGLYINPAELDEGDNLTHFIHALANTVPNHVYNKITGENKNNLEFNHIANMLVFQFAKPTPESETEVDFDENEEDED